MNENKKYVMRPVMLIAATAASPYPALIMFKAMVATDASPCLARVGSPMKHISRYVPNFLEILRTDSLRLLFPLKNIDKSMKKEMNWLNAVAIAAPAVPKPKTKMNSGSRAMFKIPPVVMPTMP